MKFQWTNLTKGIQKDLARAAGMRVSRADEDLREHFGEPPGEALVEELWPVLRDRWLGTQPRWRESVITQLQAARLGNASIRMSSKAGQMAYLRSCRQSPTLRSVVLHDFLLACSEPMVGPSIMVTDSGSGTSPAAEQKDLFVLVASVLATMDVEIEAAMELSMYDAIVAGIHELDGKSSPSLHERAMRLATMVLFSIAGVTSVEIEPAALALPHRKKVIAGAHRLGSVDGAKDLAITLGIYAEEMLKDASVGKEQKVAEALPSILGMIATGDLVFNEELASEIAEGTRAIVEGGIAAKGDGGRRSELMPPDNDPSVETGPLRDYVAHALEEILGAKPRLDKDGDFPIPAGSALLYVRAIQAEDDIPIVRIFGWLVGDIEPTADLYRDVNEINCKLRFAKVTVHQHDVSIEANIPTASLNVRELYAVLDEAAGAADHFDTILAKRHGGATNRKDVGDVIEA